ncbi:MAG: alpha/beta hydrolase [Proteobacteria bacterium]|nr:alpha/beta hydrolase [Pseudomonadota bacterium]MCP4918312.1 alpha/beta hydrolase [Pseudomonadota bacterium]
MDLLPSRLGPAAIHTRRLRWQVERAGMVERTLTLPSGRLLAWTGGRGRPVLVVPGFGVDNLWQWYPQLPALVKNRTVVAPDLLGFGGSGSPGADGVLARQTAVCGELMESLGHRDYDVLGLSYGGFVALGLANAGAPIGKVVVSDCPGSCFDYDDYLALCRRFQVDHISDLLMPRDAKGVRRLLHVAWHKPPWLPDFVLADVHAATFVDRRDEQLPVLLDLVEQTKNPPDIRFEQPTLILWGVHDKFFPLAGGERLTRMLPNARLHVFQGTAHAPNLQASGPFTREVLDFLG